MSNKNRRSIQGKVGRTNCGRNDLWLGNPWWKTPDSNSFFSRESSDYERLHSLDLLEVRDRGEDDKLDVYTEFKENIVRDNDEVNIPWIPGAKLDGTNEEQSRRHLQNMDIKLGQKEKLKAEYTHIIEEQLD